MSLSKSQENNTTTNDYILTNQIRRQWNQEHFVLMFCKPPLPDIKSTSGSSETQIAVPKQEKRKIEKGQKPTTIWISQFFQKLFPRPPLSLAFITQAPFKYLYNHQNHYITAGTRKPKDDITRMTLKKKLKEKTSLYAINLKSNKTMTDGNPEISNTEQFLSKLSHKIEPFKKSNATSETNLESKNSKITKGMDSSNDNEDLINSKEANNEAKFRKDNPNTNSKKSAEEFSDDTVERISSSNIDSLNEFKAEFTDLDEWPANCSQNNAKKTAKKPAKKGKDSEPDSGDSKDIKKEEKKKEKREPMKKKDTESSDAESGDSKDAKKELKKDKKEKKAGRKKKDTESSDGESGDSKGSKKNKKGKIEDKKNAESTDAESVDSKDAKKEKRPPKKDDKHDAFYTNSESEAELKKVKKDKKEIKGNRKKAIKDTESTDADSESEGDPTVKKGERKDKKITKKGEKQDAKKNVQSSASESEIKKEKKEAMKVLIKNTGGYTDSGTDASPKAGIRKVVRPSDTESEGSSGFKVTKTTDDSDATSTDSKKGTSEPRRGFRASFKKTTFREMGKGSTGGRIPSSRERLPFPPCEPFREPPKPKCICQCKMALPPPKPRYAPLPGVEWIHKLL